MPQYTTVLFDLDGTLLNTLEDLAASTNHALAAHGFPCRSQEEVRRFVGNGVQLLIQRALPPNAGDGDLRAVLDTFHQHYAAHNDVHTRPYPGIPAMLDALRHMGIALGIVSNKNQENVQALAHTYFAIETAIGQQPGVPTKPAPDSVLTAMKALHADPAATLYVGDSDVDVRTAANAGLPCLAVTWGFREEEELRAAGAIHFAHRPEEILPFVRA